MDELRLDQATVKETVVSTAGDIKAMMAHFGVEAQPKKMYPSKLGSKEEQKKKKEEKKKEKEEKKAKKEEEKKNKKKN